MKRLWGFVSTGAAPVVLASTFLASTVACAQAQPAGGDAADSAAIKASAAALVKSFDAGKADEIAAMFLPKGN